MQRRRRCFVLRCTGGATHGAGELANIAFRVGSELMGAFVFTPPGQ